MSAYVTTGTTNAFKVNNKKSSSSSKSKTSSGKSNSGKNNSSSSSSKQSAFEKWLEKLFDWIEVRLNRIQRRIDNATQQAENSIGYLSKNSFVNTAMAETRSLIANNQAGQKKYASYADKVLQKAVQSKQISQSSANVIKKKMASGAIDINEYDEKTQKVIKAYQEWYEKSLDCRDAVYELQQQLKELQQTKLDNITEQFETLVGLTDAINSSSEATVDFYRETGRAVNTVDKTQLEQQYTRQQNITNDLSKEVAAYKAELKNAASIFGTSSNEYKKAQTTLEEANQKLIESQKTTQELRHTIYELNSTLRGYVIDRIKTFVDKLSSIASLAEKRGTNTVFGYRVTETPLMEQTKYNNDLIQKYYDDLLYKQKEINTFGFEVNSEKYQELYKQITDDENAIISLLSANEDLKDSIRTLRWKPYTELQDKLDNINSDLEHIQSFIRDGELLDDDGAFTNRGFAQIALIGEQMDIAEQKITNARKAMDKLNKEVESGTISQEKYNEELEAQIDVIQDAASSLFDYQTKLADMYIDQITAENEALQDLISARKDALSAKKEYYDWDKTLRNKNKDIAQLQAQINALNGVTNDAAKSRRAKLQAELAEKQEDMTDTLLEHAIEVQQQGYDKLSEDMQKALDDAIKLINGDQKELLNVAGQMLNQLQINKVDEAEIINGIIGDSATTISSSTQSVIDALAGESGISSLLTGLGLKQDETNSSLANLNIADAINNRTPDAAVSEINTALSIVMNSLGDNVGQTLKNIETTVGTIGAKFGTITNGSTALGKTNAGGASTTSNTTKALTTSSTVGATTAAKSSTAVATNNKSTASKSTSSARASSVQSALAKKYSVGLAKDPIY